MSAKLGIALAIAALTAAPALATPPTIEPPSRWVDPGAPEPLPPLRHPIVSALLRQDPALPAPSPDEPPPQAQPQHTPSLSGEAAALQAAMLHDVPPAQVPGRRAASEAAERAQAMLGLAGVEIDTRQLVVVVDRNPAIQRLFLMLAGPGGAQGWRAIGATHVSTGQQGRKDYYITPIGVFAHTDAILDFRALGTYNEHHVRGLGVAGMRVWDFGWQWALKGWHTDNAGGDIRLQMHATDPALLERRLGHPASEGCVRIPSTLNRFMDAYGVLDVDYEQRAATDPRYSALLLADRTPTPLAGRYLVVIDTSLPEDTPPTRQSRPTDWPDPDAAPAGTVEPGTDTTASDPQP